MTPTVPPNNLGPDLNGKSVDETKFRGFDLKGYLDSDYVGCNMDRKSTSGASQLLEGKLVCWSAKKQQSVVMSLAEAEYVAAIGCYSDYAGCNIDKKTTSGACQLLGGKLVFWSAKKQQYVAMSSAEAEYATSAGCCANILWMKSHSLTITSYMKRDLILKGDIELHFIPT
ncbi:hypothetical protein Tco_0730066 [Tanacetum coccineum]|uniref:Uncharacterized protein n=1 Tax=Tanacetum coccineum TaxID=301880 RepID=A0ABQ4YT71_9ASTR